MFTSRNSFDLSTLGERKITENNNEFDMICSVEAKVTRDENSLTVVYNSGDVLWIPHVELKVTCHRWETDQYDNAWHCPFKFGSWTWDGFQVDLDFYGDSVVSLFIYR